MAADIDRAWDRMEQFVATVTGEEAVIEREGTRFQFLAAIGAHDVNLWVHNDKPRYCANIDGVLSMRVSNLKALGLVLDVLCARPEPWTGNEVFDFDD